MTPVFVNKDAEYLFNLGATFIADDDLETGMRLQYIAANLESLSAKAGIISDDYLKGKRDAFLEVYNRSNLPESERTMPTQAQKLGVGANAPAVRKIPMGVSGLAEPKEPKTKKVSLRVEKLNKLGLKLNLSGLQL